MHWQHKLQESESAGWENIGTKMKCFWRWGSCPGRPEKAREEMEGRERVMVMGKGGTAQRYWVLRMETAQNQSSMSHQIMLPNIQAYTKKYLWWTAPSWHSSRFWSFIPTGLRRPLVKNLLPFHLSNKVTRIELCWRQILLRAVIGPFTWKIVCCPGYWQNKPLHG